MPTLNASPPLHRLLGQAADAVAAVRAGRSLTDVLAHCPADLRGGTQALSFRALRCLGSAEAARALMAPKPPPPAVDALLVTALALLWPTQGPAPYAEHTLVDQAVTAARSRTPAAANFVNALLRRFLRERDALVLAAQRSPLGAHNHPLWWIERLRQDWPTQWQALLAAANCHPPMALRVNARRGSAASYVQRLAATGRAAVVIDDPALGGQAVVLAQPCNVHELPGFDEGEVSVQDLSAQRAALLVLGALGGGPGDTGASGPNSQSPWTGSTGLTGRTGATGTEGLPPLAPGARVLDACAAPGGKTAHLLERADIDLLALDSDARRLARVQETLTRLRLPEAGSTGAVRLQAADARQVASWWDGRPFDAILLDAPCTASGIVRRHPDVRWLRRPDDINALAAIQRELLQALWPLVAPGGRLVYATCSIFKAEGQQQIDAFLQDHAPEQARCATASPGHLLGVPDNQANPAAAMGDGFFYAVIHKP